MEENIKCPSCGTYNLKSAEKCRLCGQQLHDHTDGRKKCPACGSDSNLPGAEKCISCGMSLSTLKAAVAEIHESKAEECEHWSEGPAHAARTAKLGVAGILILLAGALGITQAVLSLLPTTGTEILSYFEGIIPQMDHINHLLQDYDVVAVLVFIFGALAMATSMFTFKRTRFVGALLGAVFGIVAIGFLIGAFFSILALLLVATSKREFIPECD